METQTSDFTYKNVSALIDSTTPKPTAVYCSPDNYTAWEVVLEKLPWVTKAPGYVPVYADATMPDGTWRVE